MAELQILKPTGLRGEFQVRWERVEAPHGEQMPAYGFAAGETDGVGSLPSLRDGAAEMVDALLQMPDEDRRAVMRYLKAAYPRSLGARI